MKKTFAAFGLATLSACVAPTPVQLTPADYAARVYQNSELAFDKCGQYTVGGFSAALQLKVVRDQQFLKASQLGATPDTFKNAKSHVASQFNYNSSVNGLEATCNNMMMQIARNS